MKVRNAGMRVSRRDFLLFTAGASVGTAASGLTVKGMSRLAQALREEKRVPRGPERWVATTCQACPGGCGLLVRMVGKRAVKIVGNPLHPVNRGGVCPKGQAVLQLLYHPDRLRQPLRQSKRGSQRWEAISWEEALDIFRQRLQAIEQAGRSHGVVVLSGARPGAMRDLWHRFLEAYGSPNLLVPQGGTGEADGTSEAAYFMQGVRSPHLGSPLAYDLKNASYVLSFGANLLEGWGSPVHVMQAFGAWRAADGLRTKLVQISPRLSITAAKADEWVPIRVGTEAALALGIAYVLISEGRVNANFIEQHTFGYDDWTDGFGQRHTGFRTLVLSEYRLNDVADLTGVPVEMILRLGREFAANPPALALGDRPGSIQPGTLYGSMAVQSLNALVGNFEQAGGVLLQPESPETFEWVSSRKRSRNEKIARQPALVESRPALAEDATYALVKAALEGKPYPVEALILHEANPVYLASNREQFTAALARIPFIVAFAAMPDDTSDFADLLLPAPTFLEIWDVSRTPPVVPRAVRGLSQPVMPPRYGSRHVGDVLLQLAKRLGGPLGEALPFESFEQVIERSMQDLFALQRGNLFGTQLEEVWDNLLEKSGWWAPDYATADELWQKMKEKGGWWDPTYHYGEWARVFRTPSGKFEFYSQFRWKDIVAEARTRREKLDLASADRRCLPHFEKTWVVNGADATAPESSHDARFPFVLFPYEILPLGGTQGGDLPFLQQILGQHLFERWESWIEIHPEAARRLGIADGSWVWVESPRGKVRVRARLFVGLRPEVVAMPVGLGHRGGSRWSQGRGVNPSELLLPENKNREAGGSRWFSTPVRISRA